MAQFIGQWELVSCDDNFNDYMKQVGVADDKREMAMTALNTGSKVRQDISKEGDTWVVKVITAQGTKPDSYPEGQAVDGTTLDGRKVSVTYTLEGESLVESQVGEGFTSRNVRTVSGDLLTFTVTSGDVACVRTYKKV